MMSNRLCKRLGSVGIALLVSGQALMGFARVPDAFPFFMWSLYSKAAVAPVVLPSLEIVAINGVKVDSAAVLKAQHDPTAFARVRRLAAAVDAKSSSAARDLLRSILQSSNITDAHDVDFYLHFDRVHLTRYVSRGEAISRRSLHARIEGL